jgi:hypothetical protein
MLSVRVREAIRARGMLLYDAFNKFDSDKNGLLSASEVWGAFEYLDIGCTTAQDIVQFVRCVLIGNFTFLFIGSPQDSGYGSGRKYIIQGIH